MTDLERIETLWWLVHNHRYVKNLISPFNHQKEMLLESALPEDEENILKQFNGMVREIIMNDLSLKLGFNVKEVVYNLHLEEYLK